MECDPATSVEIVKLATPAASVPVPSVVEPSRNTTLPVGVPAPGVVAPIVAVNVTAWPKVDGARFDATVAEVEAWFTVWVNTGDALPRNVESPA